MTEFDENAIKIFALENAVNFNGKANQGAIVGKAMQHFPTIKQKMSEVAPIIGKIILEVNSMKQEDQKKLLLQLNPDYEKQQMDKKKENKDKRSDLPELKNAEMGKVITRIAPEPSKYCHIGHAASFLINYMYSLKYNGSCTMRFDDTNPEKEKQEFVDSMKSDVLEYLGIEVKETIFASDHNGEFIDKADKLIEEGRAYVCHCVREDMSNNRRSEKECKCRSHEIKYNKLAWDNMKNGADLDKDHTLRLKIDMKHKNAVMRDPVIFRIVEAEHYRQGKKFKVWPMYDFESAILEGELGVTHVLRSNEFESRIELQDYIRSLFDLPNPSIKQYARYNITGAITKGREIKEKIQSGEYKGWDDPRLVTLKALRRRGIVKESFYELAKIIGMSKNNSNVDFSVIASINRKILDDTAKRFFFIKNPVKINIENAPKRNITLDMHPHLDIGKRNFEVNEEFLIEKTDFDDFYDKEFIRLVDNFNFINGDQPIYDSDEYMKFKNQGKKIIHFLPNDEKQTIKTEIVMPDNTVVEGLAEKNIDVLKEGDIIQFMRFGFCRLDKKEKNKFVFWYAHD